MRRSLLVGILTIMTLFALPAVHAQTLIFANPAPQPGPDGTTLLPGTPDSALAGAMVQLIVDGSDSTISPPAYAAGMPFESTDGVQGDDGLAYFTYVGAGSGTGLDGSVAGVVTLASISVAPTDEIYIRVYDRPSSDGAGNLPTPQDYSGNSAILSLYPEVAGAMGVFYFDGPLQAANANPNQFDPSLFEYTVPFVGSGGWVFAPVAVPEPGILVLASLGGVVVLFLRRRKK